MDNDTREMLRSVGCVPTVLGIGVCTLGVIYALNEWRYWGAVLCWALMWGLMLAGLGMVVMATGRLWLLLLGLVASASSAALVFAWERNASLDPSWWVTIYSGDFIGVVLGIAAIIQEKSRLPPSDPSQ